MICLPNYPFILRDFILQSVAGHERVFGPENPFNPFTSETVCNILFLFTVPGCNFGHQNRSEGPPPVCCRRHFIRCTRICSVCLGTMSAACDFMRDFMVTGNKKTELFLWEQYVNMLSRRRKRRRRRRRSRRYRRRRRLRRDGLDAYYACVSGMVRKPRRRTSAVKSVSRSEGVCDTTIETQRVQVGTEFRWFKIRRIFSLLRELWWMFGS